MRSALHTAVLALGMVLSGPPVTIDGRTVVVVQPESSDRTRKGVPVPADVGACVALLSVTPDLGSGGLVPRGNQAPICRLTGAHPRGRPKTRIPIQVRPPASVAFITAARNTLQAGFKYGGGAYRPAQVDRT